MSEESHKGTGAWIFLSHSHRDLDRVRPVRNALEEHGHHPLMFFLKCLDDDSELDDLIRREIEARTWFVLCDSENARASRWVQQEMEIVRSHPDKVFKELDLNGDLNIQLEQALDLARRATVFVSYLRADNAVARKVFDALLEADFSVAELDIVSWGDTWEDVARGEIAESLEQGFILQLLTPDYLSPEAVFPRMELAIANEEAERLGLPDRIVPAVIRDYAGTQESLRAEPELERLADRVRDFTRGDIAAHVRELIRSMGR